MSVIELGIIAPNNNTVFASTGSSVGFEGSATTTAGATSTSGLYFKWNSTVAPWATVMTDAHFNASLQGASALSFSTTPAGGWGMGTQWIQFSCTDTSGMSGGDLTSVQTTGFAGGKNTITLPDWTVNPRKIHILEANILHPYAGSHFECTWGPSNRYVSPVPIFWEVRAVLAWNTATDSRTTTSVGSWPGDAAIDDELVFELHDGSIGTSGDAIFKSDVNASTYVWDMDPGNSGWAEYQLACLSLWWNTSVGAKTIYLKVYQKDDTSIYSTSSVNFTVVSSCPDPP